LAKQGNVDVLFLGDSITDFWQTPDRGKATWDKVYAPLHAADFGISGDKTQHVLWRITNGELDGLSPKVVVLMIGTNNVLNAPVPAIEQGVAAITGELDRRLPKARILLLGIFPRGQAPYDGFRAPIIQINRALSTFEDGRRHRYLDFGANFLNPDGSMSPEIMPDFLHPSAKGYEIWADAMTPLLTEMLKEASADAKNK
jgi:lysophospholipase L1-like esterase